MVTKNEKIARFLGLKKGYIFGVFPWARIEKRQEEWSPTREVDIQFTETPFPNAPAMVPRVCNLGFRGVKMIPKAIDQASMEPLPGYATVVFKKLPRRESKKMVPITRKK